MDRVRIIGAGLSGLFAALRLAEEGMEVEVVETKERIAPSSGSHTEAVRNYIGDDALHELRRCGFVVKPFGSVETTVRKSVHFENVLRGPAYYLFLRGRESGTVDQELYRRCLDAGVNFVFKVPRGKITDADIAATGPPERFHNIVGAGFTFSSEGSALDEHTAYALLDNNVAPGGYLVITPGIGFHSIYSVSWRELDYNRLLRLTEACAARPWVREILGSSRRLGAIHGKAFWSADPIETAERDGVRYVGEAGGFQDAIAGFGFRYAVLTAALAAESVLTGANYVGLLRDKFKDEFRAASAVRQKLSLYVNEDFDRLVESMGPSMTVEEYRAHRFARFL